MVIPRTFVEFAHFSLLLFSPSFIPIIREVKTQFLQTISIFMHVESGCILMEIIFSIAVVSTNGETCKFLDKLFLLASKYIVLCHIPWLKWNNPTEHFSTARRIFKRTTLSSNRSNKSWVIYSVFLIQQMGHLGFTWLSLKNPSRQFVWFFQSIIRSRWPLFRLLFDGFEW